MILAMLVRLLLAPLHVSKPVLIVAPLAQSAGNAPSVDVAMFMLRCGSDSVMVCGDTATDPHVPHMATGCMGMRVLRRDKYGSLIIRVTNWSKQ